MTARRAARPPYAPGDHARCLVMTTDGATALATLVVESCTHGHSRVPWMVRFKGTATVKPFTARVYTNGRDAHGYVLPCEHCGGIDPRCREVAR